MNLRNFLRYVLHRDTTWNGEFRYLKKLLLRKPEIAAIVVDVGANDGFGGSNSYPFIQRGWRGVLIEPHPAAFLKLKSLYQGRSNVTCVNCACSDNEGQQPLYIGNDGEDATHSSLVNDGSELTRARRGSGTIPVSIRCLKNVLSELSLPSDFGFLTIDTEGNDLNVLKGLDLNRWRPSVLMTEDYYDNDEKFGHLKKCGYQLSFRLASDTIWCAKETR